MLKDNHIDFAGDVTTALELTAAYIKTNQLHLKIIVEARDIDEIKAILAHGGADRILIDNFSIQETKEAVALIDNQCQTESSGGINEVTLRHYAECGVDFISSGALTHSVYNMDLSLKAVK
jgi:nicotinate-nucleotide pyrophosphorylase (carboxylating)